jgi:hypothetical protein
MLIAEIDAGLLAEVVWVSFLAGLVVPALFALVVLFSARSADSRRTGASGTAMAWGAAALFSMALFAGLVGYGVHVMLSKG